MAALTALIIASSALQAGSAIASARGQRRAASDAATEGNRLATDAIARGEEQTNRYGIQLAQVLGRQRAVAGAIGIDASQGSAAQVTAETEKYGAMDVETIRANAMREARGLRQQGQNQAAALRAGATAAYGQAAGALLAAGAEGWDIYQQGRTLRLASAQRAVMGAYRASPAMF